MKINVLLPAIPVKPGGGYKIMYEYSNRLALLGHDVEVYHVCVNANLKGCLPRWMRMLRMMLQFRKFRPKWFCLNENIRCNTIPFVKESLIRDADVSFFTNWTLAEDVSHLPRSKGKKVNLIQDYELWIGQNKEKLHESYRFPICNVVIADYLAEIVERESGKKPFVVYNAIDNQVFSVKKNIKEREPHSISMLYSTEERKGTKYGLEALRLCKKEIPDLKVELFGVYPSPKILESWIHYTQCPKKLSEIYNSTAIYFTPSNGEGWALPPAEAMFCGCALVCTKIGGHFAYAIEEQTALLVQPRSPQDMAEKLLRLLKNNEERIKMAEYGNEFVQQFTWEVAVSNLIKIFEKE